MAVSRLSSGELPGLASVATAMGTLWARKDATGGGCVAPTVA